MREWDSLSLDLGDTDGIVVYCSVTLSTRGKDGRGDFTRPHRIHVAARDHGGSGVLLTEAFNPQSLSRRTQWLRVHRGSPGPYFKSVTSYPQDEVADYFADEPNFNPLTAELIASQMSEVFTVFKAPIRDAYASQNLDYLDTIPHEWLVELRAAVRQTYGLPLSAARL